MDSAAIERRIAARRLTRVRRGIYRLGPIAQPFEREMAAVLAVGPRAVLSHRSAAVLHQLLPYPARDAFVHVTVTGSDRGRKPGIRIHRTRHLPEDEVTRRHNIPLATPARTILDLAPALRPAELEQLVAEAHRKRLATHKTLHLLIARYPRRPGVPALRNLLAGRPQFTRSRAERRLLEALRRAGFEPKANARLDGYEVDLLLPEQRVVIEVDGHRSTQRARTAGVTTPATPTCNRAATG